MNNFDDLFLQAREISDLAARVAFLDEACAHQPELRARLDALLADASAADAYFGEADTADVGVLARARVPDRALASTPTMIGPYRILERIGHGGMGDVFRAVQKEPIRREVALKLIKLGMDTQQVIARFEAERQALALMDHPHIARVLDAGADDLGHPYFVMELVRGVPITQYADEKQLTLRERLSLMQQVCQAIQHAHSKGVIHRDLKPSNILVSTQDGRPHAKVIDFGIAKATAQPLTDKTLFTQFQQFIGTPQYMSPEQAEGSLDIDTRSDVYALGVLLYELLTGGTPVEAATLRQAALHEIARIIKEQDTPKPSTRLQSVAAPARAWLPDAAPAPKPHVLADAATPTTLTDLAKARSISAEALIKTVRGELDWLVMKALEKDRIRRYETPNQLSDDIARYLEGQPIVAAPPSSTYRMKKFIRKHRAPVLAAAALLTLMTAGILGTSWGLVREIEATAKAHAETEAAQAAREVADQQRLQADAFRLEAEAQKAAADRQRQISEMGAYSSILAAVQAELNVQNYPEARRMLATCPEAQRGWEWHFLEQKARAVLFVIPRHLRPLTFTPDGQRILFFDPTDQHLKYYDLTGQIVGPRMHVPGWQAHLGVAKFSPDGRHLGVSAAVQHNNQNHRKILSASWLFEIISGRALITVNPDDQLMWADWDSRIQFSQDGSLFHLGGGRIYRVDGTSFILPADIRQHRSMELSPDGKFILTHHSWGVENLILWDTAGKRIFEQKLKEPALDAKTSEEDFYKYHHTRVGDDRWSTASPKLPVLNLGSYRNGTCIRLWNTSGKEQIEFISAGQQTISHDGRYYAKVVLEEPRKQGWKAWQGCLELWTRDKQLIKRLPPADPGSGNLEFSRDSRWLACSGDSRSYIPTTLYEAGTLTKHSQIDHLGDGRFALGSSSWLAWYQGDDGAWSASGIEQIPARLSLYDLSGLQIGWFSPKFYNYSLEADQMGRHVCLCPNWHDGTDKDGTEDFPVFDLSTLVDFTERFDHSDEEGPNWSDVHVRGRLDHEGAGKTSGREAQVVRSAAGTEWFIQVREGVSKEWKTIIQTRQPVSTASLSPDDKRIASAHGNRVVFWDFITGKELTQFSLMEDGSGEAVERLEFSPLGTRLVIHLSGGSAEVWDSRPVEKRLADKKAAAAHSQEVDAYVSGLLDSQHPTPSLPQIAMNEYQGAARAKSLLLERLQNRIKEAEYLAEKMTSHHGSESRKFRLLMSESIAIGIQQLLSTLSNRAKICVTEKMREAAVDLETVKSWVEHAKLSKLIDHGTKWEMLDEFSAALAYWQRLNADEPALPAFQALLLHVQGDSRRAIELLEKQTQDAGKATQLSWAAMALIHAREERSEEAHAALRQLLSDGIVYVMENHNRRFLIVGKTGDVEMADWTYQPKNSYPKSLPPVVESLVRVTLLWEGLNKLPGKEN